MSKTPNWLWDENTADNAKQWLSDPFFQCLAAAIAVVESGHGVFSIIQGTRFNDIGYKALAGHPSASRPTLEAENGTITQTTADFRLFESQEEQYHALSYLFHKSSYYDAARLAFLCSFYAAYAPGREHNLVSLVQAFNQMAREHFEEVQPIRIPDHADANTLMINVKAMIDGYDLMQKMLLPKSEKSSPMEPTAKAESNHKRREQTCVLLIHGIDTFSKNFGDKLARKISGASVIPFYWAPEVLPSIKEFEQLFPRPQFSWWHPIDSLKQKANWNAHELARWVLSYREPLVRKRIGLAGTILLSNLANKYDRIVIVAHSLGTVIAADLLSHFQQEHPQLGKKITNIVTMGSPLQYWETLSGLRKQIAAITCSGSWINVLDPLDDTISAPLHRIDDRIVDVIIDTGRYFKAHIGYWESRDVQRIVQDLVNGPAVTAVLREQLQFDGPHPITPTEFAKHSFEMEFNREN